VRSKAIKPRLKNCPTHQGVVLLQFFAVRFISCASEIEALDFSGVRNRYKRFTYVLISKCVN
jgi:hypothetical protein